MLTCIAVWITVGGWWFKAGGTFGSKQEAIRAKDMWIERATTEKISSLQLNPAMATKAMECKRIGREHVIYWKERGLSATFQSWPKINQDEYESIGDWEKCIKEGAAMDEKVMVKIVVKNRRCSWINSESQFVCRERSIRSKDWDEAKFVYFKVKP